MTSPTQSIGVAGMRAAETRVQARALNIVNAQTEDYRPLKPEQTTDETGRPVVSVTRTAELSNDVPFVEVEEEIVDMRIAAHAYRASAAVVRTADQMSKTLLDTVA
jgi:flagellar hook protein FlgE